MDEVGKFLDGNQGAEVYYDQDGNKYIQHPPQSNAQRWARVGVEALTGAARGLQGGRGRGGAAGALSASVMGSVNDRLNADAQKDEDARKDWAMARQAKIDKATLQFQQAKLTEMALQHDRLGYEYTREKQLAAEQDADRYKAMGGHAIPGYYHSYNIQDVKKEQPTFWSDHFNNANIMPVDTEKGVQFWEIPPDRLAAPLPAHTKGQLWVDDNSPAGGHEENPEMPEGSTEMQLEQMRGKFKLDQGAALAHRQQVAATTDAEVKAQFAPQTAQADLEDKKAGTREKRATADLAEQKAQNLRATGSEDVNAQAALNETPVNGVRQNYLASLPAGDQPLVRAIGEGRKTDINISRSPAMQKLAKEVNIAYPGYDFTRAPDYAATRKAFTSGKPSDGINAINTAMMHMQMMYDNANWLTTMPLVGTAERLMGNQKATDLRDSKTALVDELGKAYKAGALTDKDMETWGDRINAWSPMETKANAKSFIKLLSGKLEGYKNQWATGAPPAAVSPITIFGPGAQASYQHIMGVPYQEAGGGVVTYNYNGTPITFSDQAALDAWKQKAHVQ